MQNQTIQTIQKNQMGLLLSLLFFGLPAIIFFFCFNFVMPLLIANGMLPFLAYSLSLGVPLLSLLVLSFIFYKRDGGLFISKNIRERFRMKPISGKDWVVLIVVFAIVFSLTGAFLFLEQTLLNRGIISVPNYVPSFLNPAGEKTPAEAFMLAFNGNLQGNYLALLLLFIFLTVNIVGEELWWRGYILPRQELAFGNKTWIIHGILIWGFHFFKWWDVIMLIPVAFALPYLATKLKNTTATIVFHLLFNLFGFFPLILGILR